jgi:vacuolar-type H+-ATPase subunit H
MASEATDVSGTGIPDSSVETLKRLKQVETESETKLSAAKSESEQAIKALAEETDKILRAAQQDLEKARESRLAAVRTEAEDAAKKLLDDGRVQAEAIGSSRRNLTAQEKDRLLSIVLGQFQTTSKSRNPA